MMEADETTGTCLVAIELSRDEADALLHLLLCAPDNEEVPEEMTAQLLRRVAEAQRTHLRLAATVQSGHDNTAH